jgi:DNA-directed RNA polymerase subunit M/transcription elongation factor TFIIS
MALPKLENPTYTIEVPSLDRRVEFRPFLVKEEKVLMIAQESEDEKKILKTIKDIISACSFGKLDPNECTSSDIEYLFLQLRAKSVGETVDIKVKCEECGEYTTVKINLEDIKLSDIKEIDNTIEITDSIGMVLKKVSMSDAEKVNKKDSEKAFNQMIMYSIESIYDADNVYPASESTEKELIEFIDSLSHKHLEKIQAYIQNVPKLQYTVKFKCKECGHENEVVLEGIESFFS